MSTANPAMVQWQQRFDSALQAAQQPQRQGESPEAFRSRRTAANEALRHLQMAKPTGPSVTRRGAFGQPTGPKQPEPAKKPKGGQGGFLDAVARPIIQAMRGSQ